MSRNMTILDNCSYSHKSEAFPDITLTLVNFLSNSPTFLVFFDDTTSTAWKETVPTDTFEMKLG